MADIYDLGNVSQQDVYSLDEVKTNEKWIDGRDIYRKVITGSFTSRIPIAIPLNETCSFGWVDLSHSYIYGASYNTRQPWCLSSVTSMFFDEGTLNFCTEHMGGTLVATILYIK